MGTTFDPENVLLSDALTGEIPTTYVQFIEDKIVENSAIMQLARAVDMPTTKVTSMYLAEGPGAYWVGEGERIETSKTEWLPITLEAKKLGVIIPVSREFLDYTVANFFTEVQPLIAEAFYRKFDQAALFGTNSPYEDGLSIINRVGENIVPGTENVYIDINNAIGMVEDKDFDPTAIATTRRFNSVLRGTVDQLGTPIFNTALDGVTNSAVGLPIGYVNRGAWTDDDITMFTGDWDTALYGIPQGIRYAISEDATLTTIVDEDNNPINLFERDMVALRATIYIAFATVEDGAFSAIGKGEEIPTI